MRGLYWSLVLSLFCAGLAGCAHDNATSEASPGAAASLAASPGQPPDANLLSYRDGTIVRTYTPGLNDELADHWVEDGFRAAPDTHGPYTIVFELPGVADLTNFNVRFDAVADDALAVDVAIAGSRTGPDAGFRDLGDAKSANAARNVDVPIQAQARWIRLTITSSGSADAFLGMSAAGELEPRPPAAPAIPAVFVVPERAYRDGKNAGADTSGRATLQRAAQVGTGITFTPCAGSGNAAALLSHVDGRFLTTSDGHRLVVDDESEQIVGDVGGTSRSNLHLVADKSETACLPAIVGNGPRKVLVLDAGSRTQQFGLGEHPPAGFRFARANAGTVTPQLLAQNDAVVFDGVCDTDTFYTQEQDDALSEYVAAGHTVVIWDTDACTDALNYPFLPFPFKAVQPGGASADGRDLFVAESDAMGSVDPNDAARYVDAEAYFADSNQLGGAKTISTQDEHWCGHLFATNAQNANGFMQAYAPAGQGFYVYDGFDHEDQGHAGLQRIREMELGLKSHAEMPCTAKVVTAIVLRPSAPKTFAPGTGPVLAFPLGIFANGGWRGDVNVTASGSFPATVTPTHVHLDGGGQGVKIVVRVPRSAKRGTFGIHVAADGVGDARAAATLTLTAAKPPNPKPKHRGGKGHGHKAPPKGHAH